MRNKFITIVIVLSLWCGLSVYILSTSKYDRISSVKNLNEFILDDGSTYSIDNIEFFDKTFSNKNKEIAKKNNLTEEEAFIIGNLGYYWSKNLLESRAVKLRNNDIEFVRNSYTQKYNNSPYAIKNGYILNPDKFERILKSVREKNSYCVIDQNGNLYDIQDSAVRNLSNFLVVKKYNFLPLKRHNKNNLHYREQNISKAKKFIKIDNIKLYITDFTKHLKPDRNCSDDICKEILSNINAANKSIDIAIYGYSSVPSIEKALECAQNRGVNIRLVYDVDKKGQNIYPDTHKILAILRQSQNDGASKDVANIMHNKFYIFDNKTVITGSANLSNTDMSGYNANNIVVIDSPEVAKLYKSEFEQMYMGKFHTDKQYIEKALYKDIEVLFSPQDKIIKSKILPIIKGAKNYIYIPAFLITDNSLANELISAKSRGVDVKIILDALNASNAHSKMKLLRENGILVKAENYAGKMHSKTVIIDDEFLILGSMNFSFSGENKNDENVLIIRNSVLAKMYKNFFLEMWNKIPNKWLKSTPKAESYNSIGSCTDGIDNDYDGKVDSDDEGCQIVKK